MAFIVGPAAGGIFVAEREGGVVAVEDAHHAAWLDDPRDLSQNPERIFDVAEQRMRHRCVERSLGKIESARIPGAELDGAAQAFRLGETVRRGNEVRTAVDPRDATGEPRPARDRPGDQPRATAQVEHMSISLSCVEERFQQHLESAITQGFHRVRFKISGIVVE